jgi:antitoxin component of MazEF toxin-antitoxin module
VAQVGGKGRLVIGPIPAGSYRMEDLLAQITGTNLHNEADSGEALGNEAW